MERFAEVAPGVRLWVEESGDTTAAAVLLIMGANASRPAWPERLVARLAERHHVIRYDHGTPAVRRRRSTSTPYTVAEPAADAVAVLDAVGFDASEAPEDPAVPPPHSRYLTDAILAHTTAFDHN